MLPLVPPFSFAAVEEGVYRGAYPTLKNFRFMRRLRLTSLVSLVPEAPTADLAEFCSHERISLHHFPVDQMQESVTFEPEQVAKILKVLGYWLSSRSRQFPSPFTDFDML